MSSMSLRRWRILALLVALALVAAACGSDDDETTGDGESETAAEDSETTDEATDSGTDDAASDESESDAGEEGGADLTGEVILVGYGNNEGGALSLPEFRTGGEVAVELINSSGGINGATIELDVCLTDLSPEAAINCANQWIENDVAFAYIGIELASEAFLDILNDAGITYLSSNSWGENQRNNAQSFFMHSAAGAFAVGPAKTMADLGVESAAIIVEDTPTGRQFLEEVVTPVGESFGLQYEIVFVDPANPDWTAAVATAQAAGVEAIYGQLTEPGCIGMVTATSAVGFDGPVFAGSCSLYIDVLGEAAIGTYNQSDLYFPNVKQFAPPEIQERLTQYEELMTAAGYEDQINGFAVAPFSAWMQIAEKLRAIDGPITAEAVQEEFANGGTSPGWFGPELSCGLAPWPTESSHCRAEIAVWQVAERDDGTIGRVLVTDFFNAFEASGF